MDYLPLLERCLRRRIALAPALAASAALTGCLDPGDYGACVDRASASSRYLEFCAPSPSDGICPEAESDAANALAHAAVDRGNCGQEGRTMKEVVCGPENDGTQEPQEECCYVAEVKTERKDDGCAVGRPFMIGGSERSAPTCRRHDWGAQLSPDLEGLRGDEAELLAEHWTRAGRAEHAAIASFARFALHLMSVGAPADLLREAQVAIGDEIRHAELCFTMAGAYAGTAVGPGALPISGAMDETDLVQIVVAAIREGCVGETLAALEAADCARAAVDPTVVAVLDEIRDDETRHAELAWAFVAWVVERHGELREVVAAAFEEALPMTLRPDLTPDLTVDEEAPATDARACRLRAHGLPSPSHARRQEAHAALRRCAAQLHLGASALHTRGGDAHAE